MSGVAVQDDFNRRRRAKNLAIGLTIAALCLLFYVITIVKMVRDERAPARTAPMRASLS